MYIFQPLGGSDRTCARGLVRRLGNHDDISDAALALNRRQLPLDAQKHAKAVNGTVTLVNFTQGLQELMRSMFYLIPKGIEEFVGRHIRTDNYYQIRRELELDREGQPARFIYSSPRRKNWNWFLFVAKNRFLTYVVNPFLTDAARIKNFKEVMPEEYNLFFDQPQASAEKKRELKDLQAKIDGAVPFLNRFNIDSTTISVFNKAEIARLTLPFCNNVLVTLRPSALPAPDSVDPRTLPNWRPDTVDSHRPRSAVRAATVRSFLHPCPHQLKWGAL